MRNAARAMARNKSVVSSLSKVKNVFTADCQAAREAAAGRSCRTFDPVCGFSPRSSSSQAASRAEETR
jgi:hypothetical protein